MRDMSDGKTSALPTLAAPPLQEDLVYQTLSDPVRRRVLVFLARHGPKTASDLNGNVRRKLSATTKHLQVLRESGMVIMSENPSDRRKALYSLTPLVRVFKNEHAAVIDFGFCTIKL